MSDDIITLSVIAVKRQATVALVVEDEVRYSTGYEHVATNIKFSPLQQQRAGQIPKRTINIIMYLVSMYRVPS
jgi:hypothetical protein